MGTSVRPLLAPDKNIHVRFVNKFKLLCKSGKKGKTKFNVSQIVP